MTIVFDANANRSTKAMQGQEEGRGLAFLSRKSQFRDSKMRNVDFELTSDAKIQHLHLHAGKAITFDFSHCHALITLYVQFLCSDWSKFDR